MEWKAQEAVITKNTHIFSSEKSWFTTLDFKCFYSDIARISLLKELFLVQMN